MTNGYPISDLWCIRKVLKSFFYEYSYWTLRNVNCTLSEAGGVVCLVGGGGVFRLALLLVLLLLLLERLLQNAVGCELTTTLKQFPSLKAIYRPGPPRGPR